MASKTTGVDYESLAKRAVGNWRKFESFGWHDQPEDADNWCIVYTNNRDSDLLDESNAAAIAEMMDRFTEGDDPDCVSERHKHWGCGWVDGYSIRVYEDGEVTNAFKAWCDVLDRLEDYLVLDEDDYSRREYEATLDNIKDAAGRFARNLDIDLPDDFVSELYDWFSDNCQRAIESRDDRGGYPSDKELTEAFDSLGWSDPSMEDGYCFELDSGDWERSSDLLWDTVIYRPTGEEEFVGYRTIDCAECAVFRCEVRVGAVVDGVVYRAQTRVAVGR